MFAVSAFISHMETMSYFDAFYACFITYSAIGFGDYDIYVSYEFEFLQIKSQIRIFKFIM